MPSCSWQFGTITTETQPSVASKGAEISPRRRRRLDGGGGSITAAASFRADPGDRAGQRRGEVRRSADRMTYDRVMRPDRLRHHAHRRSRRRIAATTRSPRSPTRTATHTVTSVSGRGIRRRASLRLRRARCRNAGGTLVRSFKRALGSPHVTADTAIAVGALQVPVLDVLTGFLAHVLGEIVHRSNVPRRRTTARSPRRGGPGARARGSAGLTLEAFRRAGYAVRLLMNEPSAAGLEYTGRRDRQHQAYAGRRLRSRWRHLRRFARARRWRTSRRARKRRPESPRGRRLRRGLADLSWPAPAHAR